VLPYHTDSSHDHHADKEEMGNTSRNETNEWRLTKTVDNLKLKSRNQTRGVQRNHMITYIIGPHGCRRDRRKRRVVSEEGRCGCAPGYPTSLLFKLTAHLQSKRSRRLQTRYNGFIFGLHLITVITYVLRHQLGENAQTIVVLVSMSAP
jgi:hypothetical protein